MKLYRHVRSAVLAVFLMAPTVSAHHGWIEYDDKQIITISGEITEVRYSNPHAWIRVQPTGDPRRIWRTILAPPARMRSRGLPQEALTPGLTVTLVGHPHRHHADEMRAQRITIGDKTIGLR